MQIDPQSFRVFLNYRREDTSGHAGRLYDALTAHFPAEQVFMDIDTIEPGVDFVEVVEEAVGSCTVLLAIIGRRWLEVTNETGPQRLQDQRDFVRLEIEAALNRKIRLIPVLVQGARMPSEQELPETMRPLTRRNAVELSDHRWRYDTEQLVRVLERIRGASNANAPIVAEPTTPADKSSESGPPTATPAPPTVAKQAANPIIQSGRRRQRQVGSAPATGSTLEADGSGSTPLVREPRRAPTADKTAAEPLESAEASTPSQSAAPVETNVEAEAMPRSHSPAVKLPPLPPAARPTKRTAARNGLLVAVLLVCLLGVGAYFLRAHKATSTGTTTTTLSPPIVTFHSYQNPQISSPSAITVGPENELWFTNYGTNSIGQITSAGGMTFRDGGPGQIDNPEGITEGPDGAIWFTNLNGNTIGRMTTTSTTVQIVSGHRGAEIDQPYGIVSGPGDELWFTNKGNSTIGSYNTTTRTVSTLLDGVNSEPTAITLGPDGTLWFTNFSSNTIGEIKSGHLYIWGRSSSGINQPCAITLGPDRTLWFTNCGGKGSIGQITTKGTVTLFSHKGISDPTSIVFADGGLWFTNAGNNTIGRISTNGRNITIYASPNRTDVRGPTWITRGPDGNLWFTNYYGGTIGRISAKSSPA
jgi:streptogramin lyase